MTNRVIAVSLGAAIALLGALGSNSGTFMAAGPEHPNVVIEWNQTMLDTFATAGVPPPPGNRLGGIVQSAVFDAVNGIELRYSAIHVQPAAPADASPQAAAVNAAYTVLVGLFPGQKASLDIALAASIAELQDDEDGASMASGLVWGKTVANQTMAWRATDGFNAPAPPYSFGTMPGQWQPTPGGSGAPKFQQLATTAPFALTSPSQFRPTGPPLLTSAAYTASFNEVKAYGGLTSTVRTLFQTETARFWQLDTPTAMWDRVADSLAVEKHLNLLSTARLLAQVDDAIADASFAIWDAKVAFNFWRPMTAIVNAGIDGNPDTSPDLTWQPLMTTPYFQEYPSAHSGVSSAAAYILASTFGQDTSFNVTSAGLPGVTRTFDSFQSGVNQVADARVFAGFHFRFSCNEAITLGSNVGAYVYAHLIRPAGDSDAVS